MFLSILLSLSEISTPNPYCKLICCNSQCFRLICSSLTGKFGYELFNLLIKIHFRVHFNCSRDDVIFVAFGVYFSNFAFKWCVKKHSSEKNHCHSHFNERMNLNAHSMLRKKLTKKQTFFFILPATDFFFMKCDLSFLYDYDYVLCWWQMRFHTHMQFDFCQHKQNSRLRAFIYWNQFFSLFLSEQLNCSHFFCFVYRSHV